MVQALAVSLPRVDANQAHPTTDTATSVQLWDPTGQPLDDDRWFVDFGESTSLAPNAHEAVVAPIDVRSPQPSLTLSADLFATQWIQRRKLRTIFGDGSEHVFRLTPGSSLGLRMTASGPIAVPSRDGGQRWELAFSDLSGTNAEQFRSRELETEVQNRSLQANWCFSEGDSLGLESCLVGLRYIQHDEWVRAFDQGYGSMPFMTRQWQNDLIGLQIGFGDSMNLKLGTLAANIKLGTYFNAVSQSLTTPLFQPTPFEADSGHLSLGQEYDVRWRLPPKQRISFEIGLMYLSFSDIAQAGNGYRAAGDPSQLRYLGGLSSLQVQF